MKKNLLFFFLSLVLAGFLAKWFGLAYMHIFNIGSASSFGVGPEDSYRMFEGFQFAFLFLISLFSTFSTNQKKFLIFSAGWLVLFLVVLTVWEVLMIGIVLSLLGLGLGYLIKNTKR